MLAYAAIITILIISMKQESVRIRDGWMEPYRVWNGDEQKGLNVDGRQRSRSRRFSIIYMCVLDSGLGRIIVHGFLTLELHRKWAL